MRKYAISLAVIVMMFATLFMWNSVEAASVGPNLTGTAADDASVGTVAWLTPTQAQTINNTCATVSGSVGTISHYLDATNFGFSIPTNATINGVVLEYDHGDNCMFINQGVKDNSIRLVKAGTISGNNNATSTTWSNSVNSRGSSSDLWGLSLTPTDVNDPTFGAAISGQVVQGQPGPEGGFDYVQMTIYYTAGVSTVQVTQTQGTVTQMSGTVIISP